MTDILFTNLALAFVTGLISSFGHCLGMCGGIVAIYSARQSARSSELASQPGLLARIASLLPLHLGRITTYIVIGALIGLAGSLLDQASGMVGWQGVFSILVGFAHAAGFTQFIGRFATDRNGTSFHDQR